MSSRPLGLNERYSVARHNLSRAPVLVFVATVDAGLEQVRDLLRPRLDGILAHDAHLSCRVTGSETSTPAFFAREKRLSSDDVLSEGSLPAGADSAGVSDILIKELKSFDNAELDRDTLIRVVIYPSAGAAASCCIALAIHHVLIDGRGAMNLFQALLSSSPLPSNAKSTQDLAPAQDPASTKPPLTFLLPIVFRELLLPKLPKFIANFFPGDKPFWPEGHDVRSRPSSVRDEFGMEVLAFEGDRITPGLKRAAAKTGVRTINAVLHAAALLSLSSALAAGGKDTGDVCIKSGTPMSSREVEVHGKWTGVHFGFYEKLQTFSSDMLVWPIARQYAEDMRKPSTIQCSLYAIGMLGFIPSSPNKGIAPEWTSWETFFAEKYGKDNPSSCSFELSNPGALTLASGQTILPVRNAVWAQSPKAGTAAILLQPLGLVNEGAHDGLSVSIAWLKEAVDAKLLATFVSNLRLLVALLAEEDEQLLEANVTFGEISSRLRAQ